MKIQVYSYSDKGNREKNEDTISVLQTDNELLAVAADGLGGYCAGEIASRNTAEKMEQFMLNPSRSEDWLLCAVEEANTAIREKQKETGNMMSTVAALWISAGKQEADAVNVGDTRIYQFRNGEIIFQSADHSVAQMAVYAGKISREEIRAYPGRNRLTRALGAARQVKAEHYVLNIQPEDSFLLCTDGFWEVVSEEEILTALCRSASPEEWLANLRKILEQENKSDQDNHSAIALTISSDKKEGF